ncbi:MAG: hypothetical protein CVU59_11170 [Deltaproteobacteria bacterium HGW-Deltaproteobacteria-17]|nr:MAG: hypothetical protein CVU59_11170 [Deltaproteobacteria bacterium HGW-Deltaproteobacteria-17]
MKRPPLSRWFLLPLTVALLTQCRPSPSATPVDPKTRTPPQPVEAKDKQKGTTLPQPPVAPPVEAVKKAPAPKRPEFRFVSHPSLTLKKIGSLTQPVQSLALHPNCKAVAAGAKNWELARFGSDGKLAWSTRKVQVACPAGNRCSEFPRAQFLPNDNLVAMMDGDSLRMFSPKGRMLALRGGFLQAVLDFRVSPDGKIVGALYPHGLALWRTTGGLLRKVEIPGATSFDFFFRNVDGKTLKSLHVASGDQILGFDLEFKERVELHKLDGPVLSLSGSDYLTPKSTYLSDKTLSARPLPPDSRVFLILPSGEHRMIAVRDGKFMILGPHNQQTGSPRIVDTWELAGVTPGADPVVAANDKCLAIASGNDVYFLTLPDPLP